MQKFSFHYVKQHPVMFGAILLVFGFLFWLLLNRSGTTAASAGGTTVVQSGPSDAQVAAGVALQQAQLGANTQIALAQLSLAANGQNNDSQERLAAIALQGQMADIQANYNLGQSQIAASVVSLQSQLANNLAITNSNNDFMLGYAKNAQDAATAQLMIGANLQATLGAQQLDAFKYSVDAQKFETVVNTIPTLKSGKRDNAFALLLNGGQDAAAIMAPNGDHSGGGFNPLALIGGAAGAVAFG